MLVSVHEEDLKTVIKKTDYRGVSNYFNHRFNTVIITKELYEKYKEAEKNFHNYENKILELANDQGVYL